MPTREQKIEAIRKAAILANPEIVELKFGCEIQASLSVKDRSVYKVIGKNGNSWVCRAGDDEHCHTAFFGENSGFLIIGHPVRLADVLLAVCKGDQKHIGYIKNDHMVKLLEDWNLHADDLELQKDSLVSFLYELVK